MGLRRCRAFGREVGCERVGVRMGSCLYCLRSYTAELVIEGWGQGFEWICEVAL